MGVEEGEGTNREVETARADVPVAETPPRPVMKRRTLSFAIIDAIGGEPARVPDRGVRASVASAECEPPPAAAPDAVVDDRSRTVDDRSHTVDDANEDDEQEIPMPRPSEVSTVPSPAFDVAVDDSSADIAEISASALESERAIGASALGGVAMPRLSRPTLALELGDRDPLAGEESPKISRAISEAPRPHEHVTSPAARGAPRPLAVALLFSHGVVAVVVGLVVRSGNASTETTIAREPNVALVERTPLVDPAAAAVPPPPAGGCAPSGASRLLASRAQIGPGLDVSVLATGFGVALASAPMEVVGLRVEGSGLRIAETVRTKASSFVGHAVVDPASEDDGDALGVRIDQGEARTIVSGGDRPAFRVVARGGAISALLDDEHGLRVRHIWPLPGARTDAAPAGPAQSPDLRGFTKVEGGARPVAPAALETLRAASRDDGGAVIAVRRPSTIWLGVADAWLAPAAPLVPLVRRGATIGTPAVVSFGGGGAVAWAERTASDREWTIAIATFEPGGDGAAVLGPVNIVGKGMSPTLAALPDGELLLAYADGPSGAHHIVARRLARDLEPRGELFVVSPESINAGQPVAAVRPDGRAIVAFFAAEGGRAASVIATPLACAPRL